MQWTYDADERALYIRLSDEDIAGQVEMLDGTLVDVDGGGRPTGIEVIRSWAEWDIDAVADRFGLDPATVDLIRWVANSPLARTMPTQRDGRLAFSFEAVVSASATMVSGSATVAA
jgi:uncharacterized protein YuzE